MGEMSAWIAAEIASASFWEAVEYWAMGAVTAAVIGEYAADRIRKYSPWKGRVEKWSARFLILALAIELFATVRTNTINNLTIADLGNKAQQAAVLAGKLGVKVDSLNEFVEKKARIADEAKRTLDAMAIENMPREFSSQQKLDFVRHLEQFHGVSVDIYLTNGSTPDAPTLASILGKLLLDAQWNLSGVSTLLSGPIVKGVIVATRKEPAAKDKKAANALARELNLDGIAASDETGVTDNPVNVLGALVGPGGDTHANIWVVVGSKP